MDNPQYYKVFTDINWCGATISFKPYYKWITLNTGMFEDSGLLADPEVLNLIING